MDKIVAGPQSQKMRFATHFGKALQAATCILAVALAAATPAVAQTPTPTIEPIPDSVWQTMQDTSWHGSFDEAQCDRPEDCACPARVSLALVSVPYRDFEGAVRMGQLIVAADVASEVADIFLEIFDSGAFQIELMEPVNRYGGDDDASMAANNTSAFNCRLTTGGSRLSSHAFGTAIDINPMQNPFVKGATTLPPAGAAFDEASERVDTAQGVIVAGDVVTRAFAKRGWAWGGDWTSLKDYQHFSKDGR